MGNSKNEKFIEMTELCQILKAKDVRTAEKWCRDNDIVIQVLCKKRVVYRFMVELELDRQLVAQLQSKYPDNWEELYRCYCNDDQFQYAMICETEKDKSAPVMSLVEPKSEIAQNFAKLNP